MQTLNSSTHVGWSVYLISRCIFDQSLNICTGYVAIFNIKDDIPGNVTLPRQFTNCQSHINMWVFRSLNLSCLTLWTCTNSWHSSPSPPASTLLKWVNSNFINFCQLVQNLLYFISKFCSVKINVLKRCWWKFECDSLITFIMLKAHYHSFLLFWMSL